MRWTDYHLTHCCLLYQMICTEQRVSQMLHTLLSFFEVTNKHSKFSDKLGAKALVVFVFFFHLVKGNQKNLFYPDSVLETA